MVRFSLPADGQLTDEQKERLAKLEALGDEGIDLSDIPEITEEQWATRRPGHYRPVKQPVTIRLDSDVVGWFKDHAGDAPYQTEINRVLRQHVARQLVQERKKRA
jgi:uncharacterized protein (DUF4415 family)